MQLPSSEVEGTAAPAPSATIYPARFARRLALITLLLVVISTAGQLFKFTTGHGQVYGLIQLFFVGQENNIPTYFSSLIVLISAVLLGVIASYKRREEDVFARRWAVLALIFLYISMDEMASIHEMLIRPMRELFGTGGLLYFGWVVPFAALLVVFAWYFIRFWLHLPQPVKGLVAAAGLLYVGGAMGVELLGGRHADLHGTNNLPYRMYQTVEESMEMFGVVLFIYGLLKYMSAHAPVGAFHVRADT